MNNYDIIRSEEVKYLIYIIDELSRLENIVENYFKKRDSKINLILKGECRLFRDITTTEIEKIKNEINKIPFDKPNVNQMEEISKKINDLVNYFNSYVGDYSE